jgi:hypothetical protein
MTMKCCGQADLEPGDLIEIKYRVCRCDGGEGDYRDRWIGAEIVACDQGTWPLARLIDGQITEVRCFMVWRYASSATDPNLGSVPGSMMEPARRLQACSSWDHRIGACPA